MTTKAPFKFSARTRVGFSDTDAQGIVYYGRYNPYFDLARVEYHRMLGLLHREPEGDFVMRANDVEYFAPARFDDELEIHVRVSRIGRTSVTFEFAAHKTPEGTLMVTAHQTLVYIDLAERKAAPLPEAYRATIASLEGDDAEH
jgi:acyl-CoA thioester hydrolase